MKINKIAIYLESSECQGGVNRVTTQIAEALVNQGLKVCIISRFKGKSGLFNTDPRVRYVELFTEFHTKYLTYFIERKRLSKVLRENNIDVLISNGGMFYAIAIGLPVKHIVWDHVSFWHGNFIHHLLRKLAAYKADAVVALAQDNVDQYMKFKWKKALICKINNPAVWDVNESADIYAKKIIASGYIGEQKGFDLLLKAWNLIPQEKRLGWELRIAGGDEGDLTKLQNKLKELNIEEISFLGFRSDIKDLFLSSSFFVMSSRWEGMPMVLLEAQACGLPIVSFDCKTGPAEILTPNSGILVPAESIKDLAYGIEKLMDDIDCRKQMSVAAKNNIQRFKIDIIIKRWLELFNNI